MATYYRWRRSSATEYTVDEEQVQQATYNSYSTPFAVGVMARNDGKYWVDTTPNYYFNFSLNNESGSFVPRTNWGVPATFEIANCFFVLGYQSFENQGWGYTTQNMYKCPVNVSVTFSGNVVTYKAIDGITPITKYTVHRTDEGYVYSTSSSAYPNGGVSGNYYYDQRTTVTSPTAPTGLTYPNPITTPTVTVNWNAATSNTSYPVVGYRVTYGFNNDPSSYSQKTVSGTSVEIDIPQTHNGNPVTQAYFLVTSKDSNGQLGGEVSSGFVPVYLAPTLTVPQMVMQGQQATVNWTSIEGADSYTLQRKSSADVDWTQVYSGTATTFSETVGTWTTVQYRVQAVFSGTPGGWAESAAIPVVSASALVISGSDGDLGTVVNDIPYSISTDTGNQITATITVNSAVIFSGNVGNSTSDTIPVLDLVNGEGTIVIEASVQATSGTVSAVRTWTYTKVEITFPNAGSVAQLLQQGENIWPKTLAECVRLPGGRTLEEITAFPCQVYAGSYVGTGTYGASNPTTLSFPFEPKMVIIAANAYQGGITHPLIRPDTVGYVTIAASIYSTMVVSWADNGLSFYDTASAIRQFNNSGTTYYFIALG